MCHGTDWAGPPRILKQSPCLHPPQSGETISQALLLASVLGAMVLTGLSLNADAALELMGLDHSDPQLFQLAKDFLVVR